MKSKVRPILVKKEVSNTLQVEISKTALDHGEVRLAATRARKAIMEKSMRSNHILIVEED